MAGHNRVAGQLRIAALSDFNNDRLDAGRRENADLETMWADWGPEIRAAPDSGGYSTATAAEQRLPQLKAALVAPRL